MSISAKQVINKIDVSQSQNKVNVTTDKQEIRSTLGNQKVSVNVNKNEVTVSFVSYVVTGGGGGVTDHGQLSGLSDDDHTQYHTNARANTWLGNKSIADLGTKSHNDLTDKGSNSHAQIDTHISNTNNPHQVDKDDVGLSNVPNLDTTDAVDNSHSHANKTLLDTYNQTNANITDAVSKKHEHSNKTELDKVSDGDHDVRTDNPHSVTLSQVGGTKDHTALTNIGTNSHAQIDTHIADTTNPHSVTASQVGLGSVDNTADADKPVSTATQTALDLKEDKANKGVADGYAELDATGKVPSSQLPSYTDDVLEYADFASLPATGETGKIYVTLDTNLTYRWGGSAYVEISSSLALGETSSTAYRGDRGKTAYDHSQLTTGNPHSVTKSEIGLSSVPNLDTTDAVANEHTHSNKTVLDNTTASFTTTDETKLDNITVTQAVDLDTIENDVSSNNSHRSRTDNPHSVTKTQVGLSNVPNLDTTDAVDNEHTHSNKTILDNTTASYTSAEQTKLAGIENGATADQLIVTKTGVTVDGGGGVVTTGLKGSVQIPYDCTIESVTLLADQDGSIVFDIWKDTYPNYPPTVADSITASAKPTISSDKKSTDSTLTGWTKVISAGDILSFNVDSCTTITRCTLILKLEQ